MHPLINPTLRYLRETLGVSATAPQAWAGRDHLPYFLHDALDFAVIEILQTPVLLALDRRAGESTLSDIRPWIAKVRSVSGLPVVFVTQALASYERKRLIEQKVPFLVPGNQLYLPDLGVDLREYFRLRQAPAETPLSPSTQALLITALLRPDWEPQWHPATAGARLGYTPMTISRATRELAGAGLADIIRVGRSQFMMMSASPREIWERAAPVLRSPVQRTIWSTSPIPADAAGRWRWAGLSALARRSMLDDPRIPVMAVGRADWPLLRQQTEEIPEPLPGSRAWQVWHYSPALSPEGDSVDPLSLILSLRDSTDERVQSALESVKEQLPW